MSEHEQSRIEIDAEQFALAQRSSETAEFWKQVADYEAWIVAAGLDHTPPLTPLPVPGNSRSDG